MIYLTEPLNTSHNKAKFNCGQKLLDTYIHQQAKQDVKRHLVACFVFADERNEVKGYFTLSSASIDQELIPENIKNKLPNSYTNIPVTLLGRLAVDKSIKGKGVGEKLLLDAIKRCLDASSTIGSLAVVVDPIDENAKKFYLKYGFIYLPDTAKMFLAMKTIAEIFS